LGEEYQYRQREKRLYHYYFLSSADESVLKQKTDADSSLDAGYPLTVRVRDAKGHVFQKSVGHAVAILNLMGEPVPAERKDGFWRVETGAQPPVFFLKGGGEVVRPAGIPEAAASGTVVF
jgi:hypothetical protein